MNYVKLLSASLLFAVPAISASEKKDGYVEQAKSFFTGNGTKTEYGVTAGLLTAGLVAAYVYSPSFNKGVNGVKDGAVNLVKDAKDGDRSAQLKIAVPTVVGTGALLYYKKEAIMNLVSTATTTTTIIGDGDELDKKNGNQ